MNTLEALAKRKSVRGYTSQAVEPEKLETILQYGNKAPNAGPFHMTVIRKQELLQRINDAVSYTHLKDKLYIGLGLYGRAWGNGGSSNLAIINQIIEERNITVQYESGSEVPYFRYTRDAAEGERIVYYEDAYSVGVKAALVKRYQLAGIAIWRMGIVPDDVYQAIVDSRP